MRTYRKQKTYRDIYPTGRKHCSYCGCWRPLIDFSVRVWVDLEHTVPRLFASHCHACDAAKARERTGCKLRNWYPHGKPGSERYRQYSRQRNKASHDRRMENPEYRDNFLADRRIHHLTKTGGKPRGVPPKEEKILVDPQPFLDWVDRYHPVLSSNELSRVSALRGGSVKTVDIGFIDEIMTRNGRAIDLYLCYPLEDELSDAA